MVLLVVVRENEVAQTYFNTVTEAFKYYLKYWATIGQKLNFLYDRHKRLSNIKDEEEMKELFNYVFPDTKIFIREIEND